MPQFPQCALYLLLVRIIFFLCLMLVIWLASYIATSTGHGIDTISRLHSKHCSHLSKSLGGRPSKLSPANICHAQCFISSGKVDTAVDVAKVLRNVTNQ